MYLLNCTKLQYLIIADKKKYVGWNENCFRYNLGSKYICLMQKNSVSKALYIA